MNATIRIIVLLLFSSAVHLAYAKKLPLDPVNSPVWEHRIETLFGNDANIVIAKNVRIEAPTDAEDQFQVPVTIDATGFEGEIEEIFVYADLNPIPEVLTFKPTQTEAYISFRMKLQQATPIRAAIKSGEQWHIASTWVDAAGGGCTAPAEQLALSNWRDTLGNTNARYFETTNKIKFAIQHPMDTGLADGIPEFYIRTLKVFNDDKSEVLADLTIHPPISENPTFSMRPTKERLTNGFVIEGMDNNGNEINAHIQDL